MVAVIKDLRTFSVAVNAMFKTALMGNSGNLMSEFTTNININGKKVEFPITFGVGPMREWKGSRIVTSVARSAYEITTKKYEKTVSIPVEDVEDDNLDLYLPAIQTVSQAIANYRSQQLHLAIEANIPTYDDVNMFSSAHPEAGANASNFAAGASPAWYLLDVSKPVKPFLWADRVAPVLRPKTSPDDDNVFWNDEFIWGARARGGPGMGLWQLAYKSKTALDAANFETAVTTMRARKDEYGETLDVTPNLLVIPPQLEWDAVRLFGKSTLAGGEENIHQGSIRYVVDNRLTGA